MPTMDHDYPRGKVRQSNPNAAAKVSGFGSLWCSPPSSHVQVWLFSNIIYREIALFLIANGLHLCVCHVFQVGQTMPSREMDREAERSRCVALD